jgi:hypothetical protein
MALRQSIFGGSGTRVVGSNYRQVNSNERRGVAPVAGYWSDEEDPLVPGEVGDVEAIKEAVPEAIRQAAAKKLAERKSKA